MPETRALLLTDIVESTKLSAQLGDVAMAALWAAHDRVARDLLVQHRGREIDKTDGFLLLFRAAEHAAAYAMAYHRAIGALDPPLQARAGLHVGEVVLTRNAPDDVARGAKPLEVDGLAKPMAARVMGLALGGQTLITDAARAALEPTALQLESHGHWRLKGVADPVELFEIGEPDAPFTPPPDGAKAYRVVAQEDLWLPVKQVKHSLPAERDAFVGRHADLRTLARRLDGDTRLVSVLGIGGSGKTRLVTRFGWSWLGDYPGGVWFCDLAEARSVDGIAHAVARGLGVSLDKVDPLTQLGHVIAGRGACLMVLDNFEQVARHAPETLGRWLDRAHEAQFVVTTREVLGLPGETTLDLAPLDYGDAVELFVARAKQAKLGFELTDTDRPHLHALVKLLDGLPLAIELAAARVRMMSPKTLLARMDARFKLLSSPGGRHTRHATLRATLDWSWDLLSEDEQLALAQLSVFEAGFTLDAAEVVLALAEAWPADAVQALVDRSWVRPAGDERFQLLVSVQEYGAEQLDARGERREAEVRHGACFAELGTPEALDALSTRGGMARWQRLAPELANVVVACRRAVARGDSEQAAATLGAAWAIVRYIGPAAVASDLAALVLGLPNLAPPMRALVHKFNGSALRAQSRGSAARQQLDAAIALARKVGARRTEGRAANTLGCAHLVGGRLDEAGALFEASLQAARDVGSRIDEGSVLINLGNLCRTRGNLDDARTYYDAAFGVSTEIGDRRTEANAMVNLAALHVLEGQLVEARTQLDATLAIQREVVDLETEAIVLYNLGVVHHDQGRPDEARSRLEAALALFRDLGNRRAEGETIGTMARQDLERGDVVEARRGFAQALAIHREQSFALSLGVWLSGLAQIEALEGSDTWIELADEAASASSPYPTAHAHVLLTRARLRLDHGTVEDARVDVDTARGYRLSGRVGAFVALADARVCHAERRPGPARTALDDARAMADALSAGVESPLGRELDRVQAILQISKGGNRPA